MKASETVTEMRELQQLAEFVTTTTADGLPQAVVQRAQEVARDTVGVIIGGMDEPDVAALANHAVRIAPGPAALLGHRGRTTASWAALVHGTAGTSLEMDEGHAFARGHAAVHALPPALALAQARNASGAEAIAAFVVGYEVAARAGVATRLRSPVHPFGAWGVLGAAATAAWFRGFDTDAVAGTLELAASYAIAPSFDAAFQGASVRNTYAGVVNRLGLLAADFYELGFRGERGGLETTFGRILGESFEAGALSEGLGRRYEIMRGYFKPYSACRYTHAAVDAVLALREDGVQPQMVRRIEVETYDLATRLADPRPRTPLAGRFSLPYVVAATLLRGDAGPRTFRPEMLHDPAVLDLASRVSVREDPAFTAITPERRPARVRLHLADGSHRERTVTGSKGDPDRPMQPAELESKFLDLTQPVLGARAAAAAWEELGRLSQLPHLDQLTNLLAPDDSSQKEVRDDP
ncbi:MAG TPA: MmgE/PrpD family protein [Candidatus Sulfomarinibacteraceae bacterium]|nr:MmgE/PrpD family protein [Candidatus Sulfomarinibacteraceae bacterium]